MPTLEFKGKHNIYGHHLTVPYRPIEPDEARSCNSSGIADDNLIIHGDNLYALKALLSRYANRVKCIYIDPPYNTGNEGWIYNDNVNSPLIQKWLTENRPIENEDMERHDKWLCMMWPRLQLLRELLAEEGVLFVSIDENEQHHLRVLLDEVFGEENFITNIAVVANLAGSSDQFGFAGAHEHCLVYAKKRSDIGLGRFSVEEHVLEEWEQDEKGYYKSELLQRGSLTYSASLHYPIFVGPQDNIEVTDDDSEPAENGPFTTVFPVVRSGNENAIWRWSKRRIRENPTDVFAKRRPDGSIAIYSKQRPQLGELPTEKPKSVFYKPEYGSRAGGQTLSQILPQSTEKFSYPKAVVLIEDLLRIGAPNSDDIVLDSFAGSGTTAHAVLSLNKEDGGNRKFILVECEDYADTITAERVRRVINGVPHAKNGILREGLGGSFTFCTLGEPIGVEAMLLGGGLPSYESLAAHLLYTTTGVSAGPGALTPQNEDGLFYSDDKFDHYMLYKPDLEFLRSNASVLKWDQAERMCAASAQHGRKVVVYASAKYIELADLMDLEITFCQLPQIIRET